MPAVTPLLKQLIQFAENTLIIWILLDASNSDSFISDTHCNAQKTASCRMNRYSQIVSPNVNCADECLSPVSFVFCISTKATTVSLLQHLESLDKLLLGLWTMEPLDTSMHPCEIFEISCLWGSHRSNFEKQTVVKMVETVDVRNPAPPGMY